MTVQEKQRLRQVESLFDGALEYPAGVEREAWLEAQCTIDPAMLTEVRRLLQSDERLAAMAPAALEALPRYGQWQATRLLGRGGMGVVYLAERADGAFQMTAAVKVVPLALASVDIEERFRRERQFLASLDHPKVARLIDGGVTSAGLPYLVMEFVDGLTIDRYCEKHQLGIRDRVALMRQVLEALAYVHGQQVIHRDLKSSNIVVDAQGNAKLLDFGTARLVDAGGDTAITKTGVFAFTPECASPEQVQGKTLTFASDIYSAGVLFYRLLTGRAPYSFPDHSPAAIADRISRTEPEASGLDAPLDAVLLTALSKTPEKRYASAAEMDADLARYLEGEPVRASRRPAKIAPKIAIAAAIVLCATGGALAFLHRAPGPASIAVLPFANLSSGADSRYLSSGLTDELTESLTRLKTVRVIAPASVAQFGGKKVDVREAGRMLRVTNLLEGSVDREGNRIKIIARLERVADGAVVWSNTYERTAADLSTVAPELSANIARSLKVAPNPAAKHVPKADALDYVLRGRYVMQQMTTEALTQAKADFQQAIDLDPDYAAAYLYLGMMEFDVGVASGSMYRTDEERKKAELLIHKALDLDPNLPAAHGLLALLAMQYDWDWERAERELQMGSEGPPSAGIESSYATLLVYRGRFEEADKHMRKLQELSPFETGALSNIALLRLSEGRVDEARALAEKISLTYPKAMGPKMVIVGVDIWEKKTELALREIQEWKKIFPPAQMYEAMAQAGAGHRDQALRLIRPYEEKYPNPGVPMQWFALVYALMGDEPNTVKWLERSADRREGQVLNIAVSPLYAPMRNAEKFRALEKRIGLAQ
jgi:eukaryotic-like serine/threonine-protein kinase